MSNPIVVEITRGNHVESRHSGSICVMDCQGNSAFNLGNTDQAVFPRSAVKAIQALPLVESGAADAFGFKNADLALACSSHSGEDAHIERVTAMLASAGRGESDLECGGHWSSQQPVLIHQAKTRQTPPGALCNNCSGKHAGFVCTAAHTGVNPKGYIQANHPVMQNVREVMINVTGALHEEDQCGSDGCSIPTYAIPLKALAHGFAKMATGNGLSADRAAAAERLMNACMAEPFYVAGTNRFCTKLMKLGKGRLFAKTGAEGVFCGAVPELGLGIALKCDDGATRAAEVMMAATLTHCLPKDDPLQEQLAELTRVPLKNWNGIQVGEIRETPRR